MAQLKSSALQAEPLYNLCIPGSHDSGAYKLFPKLGFAVDRPDLRGSWFLNAFHFITYPLVARYSITQRLNVYQQLNAGIRYLDIRIALRPEDNQFYICHNFYGPKLEEILKQMRAYLSPSLNRDIHREIRRSFVRYAKVVPLFKQMGWKVSPGIYRKVIGFTEIIAGLLLAFMPDVYKFYVSLFLMCITLGAVYTHIMVDDDIGKMYPAIAFTIMLICRLILYCLLRRHQRQQLKLRAKQAELAELKEKC
ncbi:transmembrane protein 35, partial [Tyrophagus putrescentiae]